MEGANNENNPNVPPNGTEAETADYQKAHEEGILSHQMDPLNATLLYEQEVLGKLRPTDESAISTLPVAPATTSLPLPGSPTTGRYTVPILQKNRLHESNGAGETFYNELSNKASSIGSASPPSIVAPSFDAVKKEEEDSATSRVSPLTTSQTLLIGFALPLVCTLTCIHHHTALLTRSTHSFRTLCFDVTFLCVLWEQKRRRSDSPPPAETPTYAIVTNTVPLINENSNGSTGDSSSPPSNSSNNNNSANTAVEVPSTAPKTRGRKKTNAPATAAPASTDTKKAKKGSNTPSFTPLSSIALVSFAYHATCFALCVWGFFLCDVYVCVAAKGEADDDKAGGSRYDSSLGLLTKKFIDLVQGAEEGVLDLNEGMKMTIHHS